MTRSTPPTTVDQSAANADRARGIFISYRRDDSEGQAGRLFEDLSEVFGAEMVFMDVAGIKPGIDFRRAIEQQTASCGVLLALIGRSWLTVTNADGKRRLDDLNDVVRFETASALRRDIPVIPVLVQGARMPRAEDLPDDLKELAFRNGVEITHARWDSDVLLLTQALQSYVQPAVPPRARGETRSEAPSTSALPQSQSAIAEGAVPGGVRWRAPVAALVVLLALAGAWMAYNNSPKNQADATVQLKKQQADTCVQGFVPRDAGAGDKVCVTPEVRAQTASENQLAAANRQPSGGAYGPNTCKQGFVWREAFPNDFACVVPDSRSQAATDNAAAPRRAAPPR